MKFFWTYRSGDGGGIVLHRHDTVTEAEIHYSSMRTYGGPKRIGISRKPATVMSVRRWAAAKFGRVELASREATAC